MNTDRRTIPVRIFRDSDDRRWWLAEARLGGDTAVTQGRTVAEARRMAADLVAVRLEAAPDSVELEVTVELPDGLTDTAADIRDRRRELHIGEAKLADATRETVTRLSGEGLGVRDIADLLGLSHQRIARILKSSEAA